MLSGSSPALCRPLMKASIWGVQPVGAADGMVVVDAYDVSGRLGGGMNVLKSEGIWGRGVDEDGEWNDVGREAVEGA